MKSNKVFVLGIFILTAAAYLFLKYFYQTSETASAPVLQVTELIKEHNPKLGPDDAKVKLVEFLDPECEACSAMASVTKQLLKEFEGKVQLVVRYMPFHGNSMKAATFLEEAREQGKYWEALSTLFENQPAWASHHDPKPELIAKILADAGIKGANSFDDNVLLSRHRWKVDLDYADGTKLGVKRTPTFFVNGKKLEEIGYDPIKSAIESELSK